jgi:hypothetical protein
MEDPKGHPQPAESSKTDSNFEYRLDRIIEMIGGCEKVVLKLKKKAV